ncbi:MAG: hypothetical protein PVF83_08730 [Anaerolineales bacterium]
MIRRVQVVYLFGLERKRLSKYKLLTQCLWGMAASPTPHRRVGTLPGPLESNTEIHPLIPWSTTGILSQSAAKKFDIGQFI